MSIYDEENLTNWQDDDPVHEGVYEVDKADYYRAFAKYHSVLVYCMCSRKQG